MPKYTNPSPSLAFYAVSTSDSTDLPNGQCRRLYVAGTGNLTVKNDAGDNITFTAVPAGTMLDIGTARVMSTGTSATGIIACY